MSEYLKESCEALRRAALDGNQWLADNSKAVGQAEATRMKLRREGRHLKSYALAAGRKMGIAVFGPSQAGKSTLISSLAKGPDGSLSARFGPDSLDFLKQVNPEGGNETTGLVTRFSLDPSPPSPDPGHPVHLKLFSEMDIVKILSNTYFAEARGASLVEEEEMLQTLKDLAARPAVQNRLTLDDLEDLSEYVEALAPESAYGQMLGKIYWSRALPLGSRLGLNDRAELFSFLWGRLEPFTEVYKRLHQALESLDFAETAFAELGALYEENSGRDFSVLHVDRLEGLLGGVDPALMGPPVSVVTPSGLKSGLPRPVLSALIAEMHVQVAAKPGPFMDAADVLDFPGYRAREKLADISEDIKKPETLKKCFLRGKVAYLFERYRFRKEITCMLLCVAESVQNNPDLPHVVDAWVRDTHGQSPAERAGKPVSLFLVLTKFDRLLERVAGSTETRTRWEKRLDASFIQFFNSHSWPREWALEGGQMCPFNNLFWLLNLSYGRSFLKITDVDASRDIYRSEGVLPDQVSWVDEVRQGYLSAEPVQRFFAEPKAAWEAVLQADDGGVGYIISKLTPVLTPDLKDGQLKALAQASVRVIEESLTPFYHGADKEGEREIKRRKALGLIKALQEAALARQSFGLLLRALQLSDDECHAIYDSPLPEAEEKAAAPAAATPAAPPPVDDLGDLDDIFNTAPAPGPSGGGQPSFVSDAANRFRRRLESAWQVKLGKLASDNRQQGYLGLSEEALQSLTGELIQAAQRLDVFGDIEGRLRSASGYSNDNPERSIWKQSRLASTRLNAFVNWLGLSPVELDQAARTISSQGKESLLFEPPADPGPFPELPEEQAAYDRAYFQDWARALLRLMLHNVDFAEKSYDIDENIRLGAIVQSVAKTRELLS